MKNLFLAILLGTAFTSLSQDYFQQKVDYTIDVTLNDKNNTLSAFEEFEYTNNSTCALDFIYIHLWANAYKNNETALAIQLYDMKNMTLEYASAEEKGYIDSLDFKVDGEAVKWELDDKHIDIAKIYLNKTLNPGGKITVSTPFKIKIPTGDISRLGHVGESYQITQWYPKPAVFDRNGWNEIPYLTQGEFYSEYGSFDVSITLPKNYVVGATGDLQTQSELDFLTEKALATQKKFDDDKFPITKKTGGGNSPFPDSDKEFKTIRYTQNNVHDFAWFADKRFEVLKGEVELPHSKRKVTSWCMFVPHHAKLWENSIEYTNDATFWYSKWNGDYPYNNVTAVDGTISAGGGMEYPNVTVIGNAGSKIELEVVIVHEVGHNWFYGQLGSNERVHPWMDEGMNTLNEIRYIENKYPDNENLSKMMGKMAEKIHLDHLNHHDMSDMSYSMSAGMGLDQPIELHSAEYSSLNYGAIVYAKTGLVFNYVRDYLGDDLFDKCMLAYYDKWEFKHPQPQDMKQVFEEVTGKNLDWLFEDIIPTTKQIDYKISKVKQNENGTDVTVKNVGQINSPVRVDVYSLGKYRGTQWVEPGQKKTTVHFEEKFFDAVKIDGNKKMPEVNRSNNQWHKKGLFGKIEPVKFEFLAGDNETEFTEVWYTPIIGYNIYDKAMIGFMFHNQTIAKNKFEYTIAPMFSFGRKNVSGFANLKYNFIPAENFRMISIGAKGRTFKNAIGISNSEYMIANPYVNFQIGKPKTKKNYKQNLLLQGAYLFEKTQSLSGAIENVTVGGTMKYNFDYKHRIHQFNSEIQVDYVNQFENSLDLANLSISAKYKLEYWAEKNKSIEIRAFLGANLFTNGGLFNNYGFSPSGQTGSQDYFYENYLIGRNATDGMWSQQRLNNQGGMNTTSPFGVSNTMLFTTNLYLTLPYVPLVGIYSDMGITEIGGSTEIMYDAGLGLRFIDNNFGIYFPLVESQNLIDAYETGIKYGQKIKFTLNLNAFNPEKLMQSAF
tara:strand:+ start:606 stop:3605 length:3000 start_codon:yes stop_codon:yes gene_type:complete